jgi:nitrogen fixation protein
MTINNKYNLGENVYFIENNKIKGGKITAILNKEINETIMCDYIIDDSNNLYDEIYLETTPEKALEVYIKNKKQEEIIQLDDKYFDLENKIFEDWTKNI